MTEKSYPWDGNTVGDATLAPYDHDVWTDIWDSLYGVYHAQYGVVVTANTAYSGNLAVTNPAGTTIRLATGIALVDGTLYTNSANVDLSTSGNGTYWLVLRKSWANQTVRAALVANPYTQNDGVTWDLPLCYIDVTAGVHTLTDQRHYLNNEPRIYKRQGGDDEFWSDPGSTSQRAFGARMLAGTGMVTFFSLSYFASYSVVLPQGVSHDQIAMVNIISVSPYTSMANNIYDIECAADNPNNLSITIYRSSLTDGEAMVIFSWVIWYGDTLRPGVPVPVEP